MRRLNRKGKILRNLVLALVIVFLTWAAKGFPSLTREMLLWRAARENAVPHWQEVYAEPDLGVQSYKSEAVYLRSGDDFWCLRNYRSDYSWNFYNVYLYNCDGILVTPSREHSGAMLAIGDVEADTAELTWSMLRLEEPLVRTVVGQKQNDDVFLFPLPEDLTYKQEKSLKNQFTLPYARDIIFDYTLRLYDENGTLVREISG